MTNYKFAFTYPYLVAEVLSMNNEKFSEALFTEKNNSIPILDLLNCLSKDSIKDTTIPGYICKIITSQLMNNDKLIMNIEPYLDSIQRNLYKNIDSDSYRDILNVILVKGIKKDIKENTNSFIKSIDSIVNMIVEIFNDFNNNNEIIRNLCYLLVALYKGEGECVLKRLIEITNNKTNIDKILDLFRNKSDNSMSDISKDILSWEECEAYRALIELISNIMRSTIKDTIKDEDLVLTSMFDIGVVVDPKTMQNNKGNETEQKNNKIVLSDEVCNSFYTIIFDNFCLLFEISNKIKLYASKMKHLPTMTSSNSSSFPIVSRCYLSFLDIICISLSHDKLTKKFFTLSLINELWNDIIKYGNNSLMYLKIIKIFSLYLQSNNDKTILNDLAAKIEQFINDNYNYEIVSKGVITNKNSQSLNCVYIIKLYCLLTNSNKYEEYSKIISKDLFKDEVQTESNVKLVNEDEEVFEEKKDIHDTEAFIFTTKKTIEASKKVSKKLKQLDI